MPLCPYCGTDNHESLQECMYCGEALHLKPQTSDRKKPTTFQLSAFIYLIFAFLFPFIGFIFFLNAYRKGETFASLYIFAAVINIVWTFLLAT